MSGRPVPIVNLRPGEAFRLDDVTVWRLSAEDLKDFTTTYCAAFLAVSLYIF